MTKRRLSKEVINDMEIFSRNLTLLRNRAGFTQKKLGDAVGVTPGSISNIEYGYNLPSLSVYKKLCRVLKQPVPPML